MRLLSPRMTALKPVNGYLDSLKTTIFSVMSALATEHNAVNLGQVELLSMTPALVFGWESALVSHTLAYLLAGLPRR